MKINNFKYIVYVKSDFADNWLVKGYNTLKGAQKDAETKRHEFGIESVSISVNKAYK